MASDSFLMGVDFLEIEKSLYFRLKNWVIYKNGLDALYLTMWSLFGYGQKGNFKPDVLLQRLPPCREKKGVALSLVLPRQFLSDISPKYLESLPNLLNRQ